MSEQPKCELCGEPMPEGEEMFKFHGYSGSCPKPPLPDTSREVLKNKIAEVIWRDLDNQSGGLERAMDIAEHILQAVQLPVDSTNEEVTR